MQPPHDIIEYLHVSSNQDHMLHHALRALYFWTRCAAKCRVRAFKLFRFSEDCVDPLSMPLKRQVPPQPLSLPPSHTLFWCLYIYVYIYIYIYIHIYTQARIYSFKNISVRLHAQILERLHRPPLYVSETASAPAASFSPSLSHSLFVHIYIYIYIYISCQRISLRLHAAAVDT